MLLGTDCRGEPIVECCYTLKWTRRWGTAAGKDGVQKRLVTNMACIATLAVRSRSEPEKRTDDSV